MEENYMATTRNGHELKDMYNPETNTLDIRSNGLYPSNVLSNLCSNGVQQYGGFLAISEEEGTRQAAADMQHEGRQCSENERHIVAD